MFVDVLMQMLCHIGVRIYEFIRTAQTVIYVSMVTILKI